MMTAGRSSGKSRLGRTAGSTLNFLSESGDRGLFT